jgi:hypothetical protein
VTGKQIRRREKTGKPRLRWMDYIKLDFRKGGEQEL